MSVSKKWIGGVVAGILLLALGGGWGWKRMTTGDGKARPTVASTQAPARPAPAAPQPLGDNKSQSADPAARAEKPTTSVAKDATPAEQPDRVAPSFDIVRVEPNGDAVMAGRAAPNAVVALADGGKVVAETKADAGGNFVMTPPALPPGDHDLSLHQQQGSQRKPGRQNVVVSVPPAASQQQVVVALAEPGKATTLLSPPPDVSPPPAVPQGTETPREPSAASTLPEAASVHTTSPPTTHATHNQTQTQTQIQTKTPAPAPAALAIRSVELENGSGLFASGVAPPGADIRLYLNDSRVADVIAAAAGTWSVTVRKGLTAGRYAVRADSLKTDRSVSDRVEVPFDVPVASNDGPSVAGAPPAEAASPEPRGDADHRRISQPAAVGESGNRSAPSNETADAIIEEIQTALVTRGDSLWRISRRSLGHGVRYTQIYAANAAQIRDPKLIYPGQVFVMPQK